MPNIPTEAERRMLKAMRSRETSKAPFSFASLMTELGYKNVNSVWQLHGQLVAKGLLKAGRRLTYVEVPVLTPSARRQLGKKRAA